jgi:hypothetical protein
LFRHTNDHGPSKRKKKFVASTALVFFFLYLRTISSWEDETHFCIWRNLIVSILAGHTTIVSGHPINKNKENLFFWRKNPRQRFEIGWTLAPENLDFKKSAICSYVFGEIVRQFKTHLA